MNVKPVINLGKECADMWRCAFSKKGELNYLLKRGVAEMKDGLVRKLEKDEFCSKKVDEVIKTAQDKVDSEKLLKVQIDAQKYFDDTIANLQRTKIGLRVGVAYLAILHFLAKF